MVMGTQIGIGYSDFELKTALAVIYFHWILKQDPNTEKKLTPTRNFICSQILNNILLNN